MAELCPLVANNATMYAGDLYERTTNTTTSAVEHRYFIHGSERVVAVVPRSSAPMSEEKTRYLHVDSLGSVETVTDETGSSPPRSGAMTPSAPAGIHPGEPRPSPSRR